MPTELSPCQIYCAPIVSIRSLRGTYRAGKKAADAVTDDDQRTRTVAHYQEHQRRRKFRSPQSSQR